MHRCTIDGCTMMFSSRRSRNRHSANPNAKLHVDLQRRATATVRASSTFHQLSTTLASPFTTVSSPTELDDEPRLKGLQRYIGGETESRDGRTAESWKPMRFSWCHHDDDDAAIDSFQHLTRLAEMTGNMVETTSPQRSVARRRKSMLPTRCESQQEDWSADSDVEFDVQPTTKSYSDQGELMTTAPLDCSSPLANSASSPPRTLVHDQHPQTTVIHSELNHRPDREPDMKGLIVEDGEGLDNVHHESNESDQSDSDHDHNQPAHHWCTVPGCQAAFQSRCSRDRHSGNVQLHHKLLSTAEQQPDAPASTTTTSSSSSSSRSCTSSEQSDAGVMTSSWPRTTSDTSTSAAAAACFYLMQLRYAGLDSSYRDVHCESSMMQPSAACASPDCTDRQTDCCSAPTQCQSTDVASPARTCAVSKLSSHSQLDECGRDLPPAAVHVSDGGAVCHVCGQSFHDNLVLKEHVETLHPREMYRCTVPGCDKIFSTRKSRNRHSQNDNLHLAVFPPRGATNNLLLL